MRRIKGRGSRESQGRAFKPCHRFDICERKGGGKKDWVERASACARALRKSQPAQWGALEQRLFTEESHIRRKG